ncbi:MAG: hypothetical protein QW680_06240 [Pyrobaculum sp.]
MEECNRRPDLCDPYGVARESARNPPPPPAGSQEAPPPVAAGEPPASIPPSEPAVELPPGPPKPQEAAGAVVRYRRLLIPTYWQVASDAAARLGDVVVVFPDRWLLLRRVRRPPSWSDPDEGFFATGFLNRQVCAYGYLPRGALEYVVQLARSGAVVAAMCDIRARAKPPRRLELQWLWRTEGYLVNLSPARIAVLQPAAEGKRYFVADLARRGCPAYSHWVNQILQALGVLARLTC